MSHPNRNELIIFYYQQETARERKKVSTHINSCKSCQEYIQTLNNIGSTLAQLSDEQPLTKSFDNIMVNITASTRKPIRRSQPVLIKPVLRIAFSLVIILSLLHLIQSKISLLPIWQSLSQYWIIQTIGGFGAVLILFFCICTFVTLSLAPILILEKANNFKRTF